MLMFSNGLLSTFIPEILMVLGYFLCLFAPKFHANTTENIVKLTTLITSENLSVSSTSNTFIFTDFAPKYCTVKDKTDFLFFPKFFIINFVGNITCKLTKQIDYEYFSRPPPAFC